MQENKILYLKEMKALKTIEKLKKGGPVTIVALGDSLTQGYLVGKGFPEFLSEMIREEYSSPVLNIVNRGISGDTAMGGLNRLQDEVFIHRPDLIFIEFALNDAYIGVKADIFERTIQEIINQIQDEMDCEIALITSVHMENHKEDKFMEVFYNKLINLAEVNHLPVAEVHTFWREQIQGGVPFQSLVLKDRVHPNEKGYKLMAKAIMDLFRP